MDLYKLLPSDIWHKVILMCTCGMGTFTNLDSCVVVTKNAWITRIRLLAQSDELISAQLVLREGKSPRTRSSGAYARWVLNVPGKKSVGEYQARSTSHKPVLFVTFTTSAKSSGDDELCLTWPKFCKTFDSP